MVYFMAIPRLTLHEHYNGNEQTKKENWINSSKKCMKILLTGEITYNLILIPKIETCSLFIFNVYTIIN